jgi:hypothetical protein
MLSRNVLVHHSSQPSGPALEPLGFDDSACLGTREKAGRSRSLASATTTLFTRVFPGLPGGENTWTRRIFDRPDS